MDAPEDRDTPPKIGLLWPGPFHCPHEEAWWRGHQSVAVAWIHDEWENGFAPLQMLTDAARVLLYVPVARGRRGNPDEFPRPRFSWAEVDAFEILMEHVVFLPGGEANPVLYLNTLGSFVDDLCLGGHIPAREAEALEREWGLWAERLLETWSTGCLYTREGNVVPASGHVH